MKILSLKQIIVFLIIAFSANTIQEIVIVSDSINLYYLNYAIKKFQHQPTHLRLYQLQNILKKDKILKIDVYRYIISVCV